MRRRQPRTGYREHEGYPSVVGVSRRSFLRQALAGTAVGVGAAIGSVDGAEAAPAGRRRQQVTVHFSGYHHIPGTSLRPGKVEVFTASQAFAIWLGRHTGDREVQEALARPVKKATDRTLLDGRKILRLEQAIGSALARVYRRRTRRGVARPDIMLVINEHRIRMMGVIAPSVRPIRRPVIRPLRSP